MRSGRRLFGRGAVVLGALALVAGFGGTGAAKTKPAGPALEQRIQAVEDRFALENLLAA